MFAFHKPKVFRSASGCCICGAKSSSSRFTDSKKYETSFANCFHLTELRHGPICNACVLLVKRFLKLPAGSTRHWNHVVDGRSGPGAKSVARLRRKKEAAAVAADTTNSTAMTSTAATEEEDKISKFEVEVESPTMKKHIYESSKRSSNRRKASIPHRKDTSELKVSGFLDMTIWKKKEVCCGTIFVGPFGEVAIDPRFMNPCKTDNSSNLQSEESSLSDSNDESKASSKDEDEGFFDKRSISPPT